MSEDDRSTKVICHLRAILERLNYSTEQCVNCKWVDNLFKDWYICSRCEYSTCFDCYNKQQTYPVKSSQKYYCNECVKDC